MPSIECPSCGKQSFEIVVVEKTGKKNKFLVITCCSCKQPAGMIQSIESLKLAGTLVKS